MTFGDALAALADGKRITRECWETAFIVLIDQWAIDESYADAMATVEPIAWIGMKTEEDEFQPWCATHADLLADDWFVLSPH